MITINHLHKVFENRIVLNDISLEVHPSETLAVMGSSGGGKTTLLRCVSGLIPITSGSVTVAGIDVAENPLEARAAMGMVFQSGALFDYLSVADNILFGVRRHLKLDAEAQKTLLRDTLSRVGLLGSEHLMPSEISGGMRKRVGIARALALSPKIVLYDEPTTGLDPLTTYQIDELMKSLQESLGVTSLLVSHDLTSVQRVADRVAFLSGGQLLFLGSPEAFVQSDEPAIRELVQKTRAIQLLRN